MREDSVGFKVLEIEDHAPGGKGATVTMREDSVGSKALEIEVH